MPPHASKLSEVRRRRDRLTGAVLCVLSVVFALFVIPRQTIPGAALGMPSASLPTVAVLLLGFLGALLVLPGRTPRLDDDVPDHGRWAGVSLSVALMITAIALMAWVDYIPGAVFLVAALMLQLRVRKVLPLVGLPLASALICWWLARHVLQLPLP